MVSGGQNRLSRSVPRKSTDAFETGGYGTVSGPVRRRLLAFGGVC